MNKKKFLIFASIITVIGIIGSLLTHRSVRTPISEERTFDSNEVTAIHIDGYNSNVVVLPTEDEQIKVTLEGTVSSRNKEELTTNIDNSMLHISFKEQQRRWFNFDFPEDELVLTVYVPKKQYDSLKINNDNGKVSAEQLNVKELKIETSNGRIELENIVSESAHAKSDNAKILANQLDVAELHVETSNGRIELENIVSKKTSVASDNGKISLDNVEGELTGKASNGSITLLTKNIDRNIDFQTDNGSIKIQTESEPTNVQFAVSRDNGRVNLFDKYQENAVIGDGENIVRLSTSNGNITVTNK